MFYFTFFNLKLTYTIQVYQQRMIQAVDPQYFGFLNPDPDPQKYADPRIRIQPKTAKKNFFTLKLKILNF